MKKFIKENWKFILFVLIAGLIGGYFTAIYSYDALSEEMLNQLKEQNVSKSLLIMVTVIQTGLLYGLLLSVIGIILSKKVNLWKEIKIEKKALKLAIIFAIIGGLILYPGDKFLFGSIKLVSDSYLVKPSFSYFMCSLFYGGVIEEVMIRLFLMSLMIFIISKIFYRKEKEIPTKVYVISNIIAALLFAAGHIPSTMSMTTLTPLILFRCFLLNGSYGLIFGYLYRKYGIQYSMICHGACHFISKILMYIFI